jgi:hypothetical protein
MEVGRMPYTWPKDTDFAQWELDVLDRDCPICGRMMHVCDHRYRRFHTLEGPVELVCKLNHCPDATCAGHFRTKSPELEITIALPKWAIAWDVLPVNSFPSRVSIEPSDFQFWPFRHTTPPFPPVALG